MEKCFDGINSTFIAYGQTKTGKTHTMLGSTEAIASILDFQNFGPDEP